MVDNLVNIRIIYLVVFKFLHQGWTIHFIYILLFFKNRTCSLEYCWAVSHLKHRLIRKRMIYFWIYHIITLWLKKAVRTYTFVVIGAWPALIINHITSLTIIPRKSLFKNCIFLNIFIFLVNIHFYFCLLACIKNQMSLLSFHYLFAGH